MPRQRRQTVRRTFLTVAIVCLLVTVAGANESEDRRFFESQVRPLLVRECIGCHGPKKQESNLRLDSREAILKGGSNGPAAISGMASKSRLLRAVRHQGDVQMPPEKKLTKKQIAILERWVNSGIYWPAAAGTAVKKDPRKHWSFQPLRKVTPPRPTKDTSWAKNSIDYFVLKRLQAAGLTPASRAANRTLLRRITFDLHGLPPTPQDMAEFKQDTDAAYLKQIRRLLARPQYGERWARYWLDVARYADNKGYVFFEDRDFAWAWTYRDWVIRALNDDLPYDQFVMQQLAADQMGLPDPRSLAALGFLTLGARFSGNTHDIMDDRIDVTTRGLMGLTVTCARCHDHKFDPIAQADYYSLYGVFRSSYEPLVPPLLEPPQSTEAAKKFHSGLQQRVDKLQRFLDKQRELVMSGSRRRAAEYLMAVHQRRNHPTTENFMLLTDKGAIIPAMIRRWEVYLKRATADFHPVWHVWSEYSRIPDADFTRQAVKTHDSLFGKSSKASSPTPINERVRQAFEKAPPKTMKEVADTYGNLLNEVDKKWKAAMTAHQAAGKAGAPPSRLSDDADEQLRLELYRDGTPAAIPRRLSWGFLDLLPDRPTQGEYKKLLKDVETFSTRQPMAPARAMVLVDSKTPFTPSIFLRGNPDREGAAVTRRFVQLTADKAPAPFQHGSGRLELARAIVARDNPLTARVIVNRVWQHHFGTGLVRTPSDFGLQGAAPSHPDLLDWLARWFMENGWSLKKLHELIMTSATYQQSSIVSDAKRNADPENRLLSRFRSRRLDFEAMRDALVAVSGQLDSRIGGPPVRLLSGFHPRRTIYGYVDRMDVPGVLRSFDFPDPAASSGVRSRTTVPAQALYFLNHPFVRGCAGKMIARPEIQSAKSDDARIRNIYTLLFGRSPHADELELARHFVRRKATVRKSDWAFGYGGVDEKKKRVTSFTRLPHWTGKRWQGSNRLPDPRLGWVFLDKRGGHPAASNDRCAIRRWIAPRAAKVLIEGELEHQPKEGNGVRGRLVSSRHGILGEWKVHHEKVATKAGPITVEPGDTIDLVVDFQAQITHDEHLWKITIREPGTTAGKRVIADSVADFHGRHSDPWTDFVHALMMTNEFLFID